MAIEQERQKHELEIEVRWIEIEDRREKRLIMIMSSFI